MNMKKYIPYAISVSAGLLFTFAAVTQLTYGHLHEDAYILFQYSHNVASGHGIVFDNLSGRAEGATDFLWMLLLALLSRMGLSLGTAAAVMNGIGLSVICYVALKISRRIDLFLLPVIGLLVISGGFSASLGGFSTLAFGATFAVLLLVAIERHYSAMAISALLLSLFRPDGVLLAFGSVAAAFATAKPEERKRILVLLSAAAVVGLSYFVWRLEYFGMWLPLPLLIKSQTTSFLEGWEGNYTA